MQRLQFSISWLQTAKVSFPSVLETEVKLTSVLEECLTGYIPVELATEKETQECNAVTGNSVSLVSITESDQINKDAKFLTK